MAFWDIKKKPTAEIRQVEEEKQEEEETPVYSAGVSSTRQTEEDEEDKCSSCGKKDGGNDYTCDICEECFCVKCVVKIFDDEHHFCKKCVAKVTEELQKRFDKNV